MTTSQSNRFLETEVLTASPQKLRLMLIEGALRGLHETKAAWQQGRLDDGGDALDRVQAIITELLTTIDRQRQPEVTGPLTDLYVYVHKMLLVAGFQHDQDRLDEVLRVLMIERETWQEVTRLLSTSERPSVIPAPHVAADAFPANEGFSLEA